MSLGRPASSRDLLPTERRFTEAMQQISFGRFEFLRIERGELVLDPWPSTIRHVKFCACTVETPDRMPADYVLKKQVVELFEFVRAADAGEIRILEVKNGLPFSMEIEHLQGSAGRRNRA